jgi:hypothetical protein
VCDGNLEPILGLACDPHANEFCRGTAVHALSLLAAWGEVPRDTVVAHFLYLASGGLERRPSQVWNSLVAESADIEALPVFPDLRRAYDEGLISPGFIEASWLDRVEASPPGRVLQQTRDRHPPIDDVGEATRWWADFAGGRTGGTMDGAVLPHRRGPKPGRNEPCPCGSGKKFKKCCGA